jgi:hypothetical protein
MNKKLITNRLFDMHLGCFGNFDAEDPICLRLCALNLRCTIEHDQNVRLEMIEDLVSADITIGKIQ